MQAQALWLQSLEASPGDLARKRRKGRWRGGGQRVGCGCSGRPISPPLFPSQALPAALARPVSGSRSLSSPACQSRSHWGVPSQHGWLSGPGREGLLQEPLSPRGWPAWWLSLAGAESRDPRSQLPPGGCRPFLTGNLSKATLGIWQDRRTPAGKHSTYGAQHSLQDLSPPWGTWGAGVRSPGCPSTPPPPLLEVRAGRTGRSWGCLGRLRGSGRPGP